MWRGPMLNKWIQNFLANTHWGELDYLLDLPPVQEMLPLMLQQ